jgi:phosphate:Na+ symporter
VKVNISLEKNKLKRLILLILLVFSFSFRILLSSETDKDFNLKKAIDPLGNDISGDRQIGVVGDTLEKPILVVVRDKKGEPVKGKSVVFNVLNDGGAQCLPEISYTDVDGIAKTEVIASEKTGEFILEAKLKEEPWKRVIFTYNIFNRRWLYLLLIQLFGGFALFFFGFRIAGKGLTKTAGGNLREMLFRFTRNRIFGFLSGVFITFVLQSSTAATVMLVGFLTAGLISFANALSIAIGTAVGATLTVQLIAFKIYDYALLIIAIGFLINNLKKPVSYYGQFIMGFGLVFMGIKVMGEAFLPLHLTGSLEEIFVLFREQPYLVFFISALLSALVHSSAATIGIVIALSFQTSIGLEHAIPVVLGANLGTSTTALIASIRGNRDARMFAVGNFIFKLAIAVIFLPFVGFWSALLKKTAVSVPRQIANSYTFINFVLAAILLPIVKPVGNMIKKMTPVTSKELRKGPRYLDRTVLDNPAAAIAHVHREVLRMADMVLDMFSRSMDVFRENDKDLMKELVRKDDEIDNLEVAISDYLADISQEELTTFQSRRIASLFFIIDELEHIGDIVSKSFMSYARKKIKQGFVFSEEGFNEIIDFYEKIKGNFQLTISSLTTYDKELAIQLKDERDRGMNRHIELHNTHIDRLKRGLKETIETSTVHLDLIDDLERVNFHISNIARAILGRVRGEVVGDEPDF